MYYFCSYENSSILKTKKFVLRQILIWQNAYNNIVKQIEKRFELK